MKLIIGLTSFTISAPYAAGHTISGPEALALNALRAQNIRKAISRQIEDGKPETEVIEFTRRLDAEYSFSDRKTRDHRLSRLELECRIIAEVEAENEFRRAGREPSGQVFEARVIDLASDDRVKAEASKRLDINSRIADATLEDLLS